MGHSYDKPQIKYRPNRNTQRGSFTRIVPVVGRRTRNAPDKASEDAYRDVPSHAFGQQLSITGPPVLALARHWRVHAHDLARSGAVRGGILPAQAGEGTATCRAHEGSVYGLF
ncbi:hypothetical protein WUBG_18928 [Wuchereria bancrofti]|uniref:Uncharacterized protein n=1 Tax=Wuchereria bancrofti TaxID=6293 RepID=J9A8C1_WUCBA|nr:hypothetical protein WUBG_18928 [Wuchereria bancrofti]